MAESVHFANVACTAFSEVRSLLAKKLRKKTLAPSKFIGNSSTCAFLAVRGRIRALLREGQTRREAGAQSPGTSY
jgi:hypothetical protein